MPVAQEKSKLRTEMRRRKKLFSADELLQKSQSAIDKLQNEPLFRLAQTVMLYWSLPDEVHTHTLIANTISEKQIVLPTIVGDDIVPAKLTSLDDLHEGAFHIQEPKNRHFIDKIDLIVVPCVAFDAHCRRLGRGRGYYDRFLQLHPTVPTIGLAFDFQMVTAVPCETHDIALQKIIHSGND